MAEEHPFCPEHQWRKEQIEKNCRNMEALRNQMEKMFGEVGRSVTPRALYAILALFVTLFIGMFGFSVSSNVNALNDIKETGIERTLAIKTLFTQQAEMLVAIEGLKRDVTNMSDDMKDVKQDMRDMKRNGK